MIDEKSKREHDPFKTIKNSTIKRTGKNKYFRRINQYAVLALNAHTASICKKFADGIKIEQMKHPGVNVSVKKRTFENVIINDNELLNNMEPFISAQAYPLNKNTKCYLKHVAKARKNEIIKKQKTE
jgi:hypothetical protein